MDERWWQDDPSKLNNQPPAEGDLQAACNSTFVNLQVFQETATRASMYSTWYLSKSDTEMRLYHSTYDTHYSSCHYFHVIGTEGHGFELFLIQACEWPNKYNYTPVVHVRNRPALQYM